MINARAIEVKTSFLIQPDTEVFVWWQKLLSSKTRKRIKRKGETRVE